MDEQNLSKEQLQNSKFQSKASARIGRICKEIGELSKVANRKYYNYSQEEVEQMFEYIQKKLDDAKQAFVTGKKVDETFKFV